jgi:hypothetical protein
MAAVNPAADAAFDSWLEALEQRHLSDLTFSEARRGLQALSRWYVERRERGRPTRKGAALDGAGKRAAFALFYGPLHFLIVRHIVGETGLASRRLSRLDDLGCGTGAASAAWTLSLPAPAPRLSGVDSNAWAVAEAKWTWDWFGLEGQVRRGDLTRARLGGRGRAILAAYVANELPPDARETLRLDLLDAASAGARVLVVEPIARRLAPWWDDWARAFQAAGGRADQWRVRVALPERLRLLDRAAGLDHDELTARSLCLPGG